VHFSDNTLCICQFHNYFTSSPGPLPARFVQNVKPWYNIPVTTRICSRCECEKQFPDGFFRDNRLKSGYRSACKTCDVSYPRSPEAKRRGQDNFRKKHGKRCHSVEQREKGYAYEKMKYHSDPAWRQRKLDADRRYRQSTKGRITALKARGKRRKLVGATKLTETDLDFIFSAFDYKCAYCGDDKDITNDHFIPVSHGGKSIAGNILPACRSCNSSKQNSDPAEWCTLEQLERILPVLKSAGAVRFGQTR